MELKCFLSPDFMILTIWTENIETRRREQTIKVSPNLSFGEGGGSFEILLAVNAPSYPSKGRKFATFSA